MATASLGLSEFENEFLLQSESESESEFESEYESEFENPEMFGLSDITKWASDTWRDIQTPGTDARRIAIDVDKAAITGGSALLGTALGGPVGGTLGGMAGAGLSSALLPPSAYEGEYESEFDISPMRRVYPDAMLEHIGHEAAESESELEAAEHFLPLIPLIAGKLLPLAAKIVPKIAGKVLPRIARTVTKVSPQLTRGISNITRTLFRNRRSRPLVRVVPTIARRTVANIARQAATGRPVNPQTAVRVLRHQARRVIANPRQTAIVLRRSNALDHGFHRIAGIPYRPSPAGSFVSGACPQCSTPAVRALPACCRCCGQLVTR